jgi:hypothetical protein
MSYELIAILVSAAFQAGCLAYIARLVYRLDATVRACGAGNLRTSMRVEEELRGID